MAINKLIMTGVTCSLLLVSMSCSIFIAPQQYAFSLTTIPTRASVNIVDNNGNTIFTGTTPAKVVLVKNSTLNVNAFSVKITKHDYKTNILTIYAGIENWQIRGEISNIKNGKYDEYSGNIINQKKILIKMQKIKIF